MCGTINQIHGGHCNFASFRNLIDLKKMSDTCLSKLAHLIHQNWRIPFWASMCMFLNYLVTQIHAKSEHPLCRNNQLGAVPWSMWSLKSEVTNKSTFICSYSRWAACAIILMLTSSIFWWIPQTSPVFISNASNLSNSFFSKSKHLVLALLHLFQGHDHLVNLKS